MQTRYKILILLFTVTLAVGTLTLLHSSSDNDAVLRFRSLLSNRTLYTFGYTLSSITDGTSFWYGGISLFAIIMIVLVFRAAHRGGSRGLRERLIELKPTKVPAAKLRPSEMVPAKADVESLLREELKRITDLLQAKDSSITELENGLAGKQQLLQRRSEELDAFKSKVDSLAEQLADLKIAKERAENILQQELKKMKFLQAKDSVITELEQSLTATQELLQSRSEELDALKSKVNTLTEQLTDLRLAKERAENVLQKELKKTKVLQAKDSSVEQENSLSGTVRALEIELGEKQELLQTRSRELKAAKSKVNTLREQLAAIASAKKQTENVLQQQLKQKTELLQSKDAAMKELQESLRAKIQVLEGQIEEKEKLSRDRDAELEAIGSEANSPTESGPTRKRAKSLLLQELQNRTELLQAKEAIVKELEQRLNGTVHALENARSEVERLVNQRDAELPDRLTKKNGPAKERAEGLLQSDRKGMNSKLLELGAAKARAAASLQVEEVKERVGANDSILEAPGKILSRVQGQSVLPADKDEVLETDDGRSEELNTETRKKERN